LAYEDRPSCRSDWPAPFAPIRVTISPSLTSRSTPCSATYPVARRDAAHAEEGGVMAQSCSGAITRHRGNDVLRGLRTRAATAAASRVARGHAGPAPAAQTGHRGAPAVGARRVHGPPCDHCKPHHCDPAMPACCTTSAHGRSPISQRPASCDRRGVDREHAELTKKSVISGRVMICFCLAVQPLDDIPRRRGGRDDHLPRHGIEAGDANLGNGRNGRDRGEHDPSM